MNFLPKNEYEFHVYTLGSYYYAKAQLRETRCKIKKLEKKIEEETGIKAVSYDKITAGTSVLFSNKPALSRYQTELLELECDLNRYEDIVKFFDKKYNYDLAFNMLDKNEKKFIYAVFFKGLSVAETAAELDMNERYIYRKIKKIISEMTGVNENE